MAQSKLLRDVKTFPKELLRETDTLVKNLDGTQSLERSPRLSLSSQEGDPSASFMRTMISPDDFGDTSARRRSDGQVLADPSRSEGEAMEAAASPPSSPRPAACFPHRHSLPASPQKLRKERGAGRRDGGSGPQTPHAESIVSSSSSGDHQGRHQRQGKSSASVLSKWRRKLPLLKALRDEEVCKVTEDLYVGGVGGARNKEKLLECGITHVVNASPVIPCLYQDSFEYLLLEGFYDQSSENIDEMIEFSNAFIRSALCGPRRAKVYVHCYAGVSRSATLVIAYLMCYSEMSLKEAMRTLRRARPAICPNTGFMQQLEVYEQRLALEREITQNLKDQIEDTLMPNQETPVLFNKTKARGPHVVKMRPMVEGASAAQEDEDFSLFEMDLETEVSRPPKESREGGGGGGKFKVLKMVRGVDTLCLDQEVGAEPLVEDQGESPPLSKGHLQ